MPPRTPVACYILAMYARRSGQNRWKIGLFAVAAIAFGCLADGSPVSAGEPVTFEDTVRQNPAEHIYIARINLTDPRVGIIISPGGPDPDGAGPWETTLRAPSETAKTLDLTVAINADFFTQQPRDGNAHHYLANDSAKSANIVMIDGKVVTGSQSGASLIFDDQNRASISVINQQIPPNARQIVAGSSQIVKDGKNVAGDDERAPRTAAGLADGGKILVLLVVDGRRDTYSAGMTLKELASEMIAQGCTDAINLDGGGSSTMVRKTPAGKYKVVNTPSDGSTFFVPLSVERPVAYVLGVHVAAPQ